MQLLHNDRVVIFDRTDFGRSNLSLPNSQCRNDVNDTALAVDCTAHSIEYHVLSNMFRPLTVQTDVWCSSGAVMPNGSLIQTGGFNDGERRVRVFNPCDGCDWEEIDNGLAARRWYATNHILPDGRQIIIGGRRQFNYEFYPKTSAAPDTYTLPFLLQTRDPEENNLYPFVYLNVDGNLFVFANNRAILLNYTTNKVVRRYPMIPGGEPRSYPSTGSSVLLPLKITPQGVVEVEVLICGGAPKGSYNQASSNGVFMDALNTCGRIKINDPNPQWVMESMPQSRVMGDMTLLPNGNVLIINGAAKGSAGWELGRNPVLNPVIYLPENATGSRFETQVPSIVPRMYHSTAILLRDGRVLVGGSNPHTYYNFTGVLFPTELSLEAFSPPYLDYQFSNLRPKIVSPASPYKCLYNQTVKVEFTVRTASTAGINKVKVTVVAPSFTTHSFSMNQRLLVLGKEEVRSLGKSKYEILVRTPVSKNLAPPGYYLLFVVHQEIPSEGIWVNIQ